MASPSGVCAAAIKRDTSLGSVVLGGALGAGALVLAVVVAVALGGLQ
jgi:hypothetical protein